MLPALTRHIECALISYLKQVEHWTPSVALNRGVVNLVAQAEQLSAGRRHDILAIDRLCETALNQGQSPHQLIEAVLDYVNQMKTGFLFFSGGSKLRDAMVQAIEQYDLHYLHVNQSGQMTMTEITEDFTPIHGQRHVNEMQSTPLWQQDADTLGPVQFQIEQLMRQMQHQKEQLREYQAEMAVLRSTLSDSVKECQQLRMALSEAYAENVTLRERIQSDRDDELKETRLTDRAPSIQSTGNLSGSHTSLRVRPRRVGHEC